MLGPGRTWSIRLLAQGPQLLAQSLAQGGSPVASLPYFESDASISDKHLWSEFAMMAWGSWKKPDYFVGNPVKVCL